MIKPLISIVIPTNHLDLDLINLKSWVTNSEIDILQLILVVDEMLQEFGREIELIENGEDFPRIVIVRGRFGNPGAARNAGINLATAEWIAFWDSDDMPDPPAILRMISEAQKTKADIAIGSFRVLGRSGLRTITTPLSRSKLALIRHLTFSPGLWRFCFKAQVLSGCRFPELRMGEDQIFLAQVVFSDKRVFLSPEVVYTYSENNPQSLTHDQSALSTLGTTIEILRKITAAGKTNALGPAFLLKIFASMSIRAHKFADLRDLIALGKYTPKIVFASITGFRLKKSEKWEVLL
jgi:glycosyltransferase involved in cell wall biosynthesis